MPALVASIRVCLNGHLSGPPVQLQPYYVRAFQHCSGFLAAFSYYVVINLRKHIFRYWQYKRHFGVPFMIHVLCNVDHYVCARLGRLGHLALR